MRPKHLVTLLVLLALAVPASPAHAGGIVSVCDEAHLRTALAGGGTVTFSCSGTIILAATVTIPANTTIDGSGQDVTISGNNAVRVFVVDTVVTLNLNVLTVADGSNSGYPGGGGILNRGTLAVTNSTFAGNSTAYAGGGIYNSRGTLTVTNSTFAGNSAAGPSGNGGGIRNYNGTTIVSNSIFSDNSANTVGGGIDNYYGGTLTVSSSTFSGNSAGDGGGIDNCCDSSSTVIVSNSTFSGNSANEGNGGGISNGGTLNGGTLAVSNSTFSANSAYYGGGGLSNAGIVTISNSTFSSNSTTNGDGGGIKNYDSVGAATTLKNTIVANSPTGNNCAGTITDGGGNLSYPDTTCPGINSDPLLGPLQNNVGPTETMQLGPGSAAIDAGNDAICAAAPVNNRDQRGIVRPWGMHCDIGAVEQVPLNRIWLPTVRSQ